MPTRTDPPHSPRWLTYAAWGAFLATIPSATWRVLMIVGLMPGTAPLRDYELAGNPSLGYAYVFALSIVQLLCGFLTVGLVKPWGERFLGRRIPVIPVIVAAVLGGLAVTYLFNISLVHAIATGDRPDRGLVVGFPLLVMLASYAPILLWGPLVLISAYGYWQRRRRTNSAPETARPL